LLAVPRLDEGNLDISFDSHFFSEKWPSSISSFDHRTSNFDGKKKLRRNRARGEDTRNMWAWRLQGKAIIIIVFIF